jgi:hypothetical protein
MASMGDIAGIQQTATAILSAMQETLAKTVPTNSTGYLDANTLLQSGFTRVLGISVMTGGTAYLHDCATLADAGPSNQIYLLPATAGFYATNMVFHKGLVLVAGATKCAIFYTRV